MQDVTIFLQKVNAVEWWKCVIVGDAEIDTQLVEPENSKLDDLDGSRLRRRRRRRREPPRLLSLIRSPPPLEAAPHPCSLSWDVGACHY